MLNKRFLLLLIVALGAASALAINYTKYSYMNIVNSIMSSTAISASTITTTPISNSSITSSTIQSSTIDSTVIGGTAPANGTFNAYSGTNGSAITFNTANFQINGAAPVGHTLCGDGGYYRDAVSCGPISHSFSFTGCNMNVTGNSFSCRTHIFFSSIGQPSQPDGNYSLVCSTYTGQDWGSSTGINGVDANGFDLVQNVDRYNGHSANVSPAVFCILQHL